MVTRILLDPRRDLPGGNGFTSDPIVLEATPTSIREDGSVFVLPTTLSFTVNTAADIVQLPPPAASWAWRLVARQDGVPIQQRTVRFPDVPSIGYADLTDVNPTSLGETRGHARQWDATFFQIATLIGTFQAQLDALTAGAPTAFNTFLEVANQIGLDETTITALQALVAGKANVADLAQKSLSLPVNAMTTSGTAVIGARNSVNASTGPIAVTMPAPTAVGQHMIIERADTSAVTANAITITGTIRGTANSTVILAAVGAAFEGALYIAESLTSWAIAGSIKPRAVLDAAYDAKGAATSAVATQAALDLASYVTYSSGQLKQNGVVVSVIGSPVTTVAAAGTAQALTAPTSGSSTYNVTGSAGSCAFSFTAIPTGVLVTITLLLRQDATGGRAWTFPANVNWPNGQLPVLSTAPNRYDVVTLVTVDGGAAWTGALASTNTSVVLGPNAPVLTASAGVNQVSLAWQTPNPGGASLTGYTLERRTGNGTWSTIATPSAAATSYIDGSLTAGVQLGYRLTATNAAALTATSTEATATPSAAPVSTRPASAPSGVQPARWYRADHALATNGTVTSWPDEMGSSTAATPGKAVAPTLIPYAIGAQSVLRFAASTGGNGGTTVNATGQNMVTDYPATPEAITVLAVIKPTAIGSAGFAIGPVKAGYLTDSAAPLNSLTGGLALQIPTTSTGGFEVDRAFAAALVSSGTGLAAGATAVIAASIDTNANSHAVKATVNGGTIAAATPSAYTATTGLLLGIGGSNNGQGNTFFSGDVAEVLVFPSALSDTDRHNWTQYLATTYGLTIGAN